MRLLVSVASASDAEAALAGGADLIDAKDPSKGALGAVTVEALREIHSAVGGTRPVTAALGDATDEGAIEETARAFGRAATFVKIGFDTNASRHRIQALIAAAVRGASDERSSVVAVTYADVEAAVSRIDLIAIAAQAGARGVLLDTADKRGPGLLQLMPALVLERWIARARQAGLFVAVAGKLEGGDLLIVRDAGADIAGVRGAVCDGGRSGYVVADKVRGLTVRLTADTTYAATPNEERRFDRLERQQT
jgi:uncharacterized protein (UPF0264 family)